MLKENQLEKFELESRVVLKQVDLTYHVYGKLNALKDNVIWVCHALTASGDLESWWSGMLGGGKPFDPEKYFIICLNNLGSPYGTCSPRSVNPANNERYGLDFPFFTIRDTANLHLELLKLLGISKIKLLIGGSCGGNIALEMSYTIGNQIEHQVLLCSSAKESAWTIGIHESQRMVLEGDADFQINKDFTSSKALGYCRSFAMPYYRNQINFVKKQEDQALDKIKDFKASSYLRYQADKFSKRFDAHCYYMLLLALDTHNIGRGRGSVEKALGTIKTRTTCIALNTDIFIPPNEQRFLADHLPHANYVEIESDYGHDGFLIELDQIAKILEALL